MKKNHYLLVVVFSALIFMYSCRTHQTCPAYGHSSLNMQKVQIEKHV